MPSRPAQRAHTQSRPGPLAGVLGGLHAWTGTAGRHDRPGWSATATTVAARHRRPRAPHAHRRRPAPVGARPAPAGLPTPVLEAFTAHTDARDARAAEKDGGQLPVRRAHRRPRRSRRRADRRRPRAPRRRQRQQRRLGGVPGRRRVAPRPPQRHPKGADTVSPALRALAARTLPARGQRGPPPARPARRPAPRPGRRRDPRTPRLALARHLHRNGAPGSSLPDHQDGTLVALCLSRHLAGGTWARATEALGHATARSTNPGHWTGKVRAAGGRPGAHRASRPGSPPNCSTPTQPMVDLRHRHAAWPPASTSTGSPRPPPTPASAATTRRPDGTRSPRSAPP